MAGVIKEWSCESDHLNRVEVNALGFYVDVFAQLVLSHVVKTPPRVRTKVWTDFGSHTETFICHARGDQNDMDVIPINLIILTIHGFAATADRLSGIREAVDIVFGV